MALENGTPPTAQPRVILTTKDYAPTSDREFSCSDIIRGYITLARPEVGIHQLEATWILPSGEVEQHFSTSLNFPPPGRQTAMVWIQINSNQEGLLSSVQNRQDSPNTLNSLGGDWQLDIQWDGKPLHHTKFKVRC
jgi:hypothetical protein